MRMAEHQSGFVPLHKAAMEYALQGVTTLEEVLRLVSDVDEEKAEILPEDQKERPSDHEPQDND